MRRVEQRAPRRLIDPARLHADQPVFDDVGAADAVRAGEIVERLEQCDRTERLSVDGHGRARIEADLHHGG